MVPMKWGQIKNLIPFDLARLQATSESCRVESEHCWVLQVERGTGSPGRAVCAPMRSRASGRRCSIPVVPAARSGEVRLATWAGIDTAGRVWTIAGARLKAKPHELLKLTDEIAQRPRGTKLARVDTRADSHWACSRFVDTFRKGDTMSTMAAKERLRRGWPRRGSEGAARRTRRTRRTVVPRPVDGSGSRGRTPRGA